MQTITIKGKIIPKARPRASKFGHVYMPENYRTNQGYLAGLFTDRLEPVDYPVHLAIACYGKWGKADCDNLAGSVMDALVKAGILKDDSTMHVPSLCVVNYRDSKELYTEVIISEFK